MKIFPWSSNTPKLSTLLTGSELQIRERPPDPSTAPPIFPRSRSCPLLFPSTLHPYINNFLNPNSKKKSSRKEKGFTAPFFFPTSLYFFPLPLLPDARASFHFFNFIYCTSFRRKLRSCPTTRGPPLMHNNAQSVATPRISTSPAPLLEATILRRCPRTYGCWHCFYIYFILIVVYGTMLN